MASLYRKYRSRSFDDLVGQDHVVRTLRNAVRQRRVGHAYLFTGPRGTGKTSSARILAKAVNCLHPREGNPCNECERCVAANQGRAMDVIEIDAASNTSVENVRELRERVGYASSGGSYKVYIVDEVHRLSGAAFDAFLKTLEEPPPHVIFVFASTEPHKVPETITSRCQRFDFRRIAQQETLERLVYVARTEGVEASDDALNLIAQHARGSLRDALGLLDQVTAYASGSIDAAEVRTALGLADPMLIGNLTEYLLNGSVGDGLAAFQAFAAAGGDPGQLAAQLVEYWRALLLQVAGAPVDPLAVDPALAERLPYQGGRLTNQQAVQVIRALTEQEYSSKFNIPPELSFELRYVQAGLALGDRSAQPRRVAEAAPPQPAPPLAVEPVAPPPEATKPDEVQEPPPADAAPPTAQSVQQTASAGATGMDCAGVDRAWDSVVSQMRSRSPSLQAVLRSGHLLKADQGELTIGFLYDFHCNQFADTKKRKLLEQVVEEVLGVAYRVRCIRTTREEVERVRGVGALPEDDGFMEEAAERLRAYHARQMGNGHS